MVVRQFITLPSQMQLIDRLQHHIYLSSSLIFLSAEQGAGKNTLLEQLTNKLPNNTQEAFIQLTGQLSDSKIREKILLQLYDNPLFDAQDSLLSTIYLLEEKHSAKASKLIVIDNADFLSSEFIVELAELITHKSNFGDNEINVLFLSDQVSSREMFTSTNQKCACLEFKLEPLSGAESYRLLDHIFKQAGYQHKLQHQDAVSNQLITCGGIPKKITQLAEKIIAGELINEEPSWLKLRLPSILLMLLLLLVAGVLGNYLYSKFITFTESSSVEESKIKQEPLPGIVLPQNQDESAKNKEKDGGEDLAGSWKNDNPPEVDENELKVGLDNTDSQEEIMALVTSNQVNINTEEDVEHIIEKRIDVTEGPAVLDEKDVSTPDQNQSDFDLEENIAVNEPVSELTSNIEADLLDNDDAPIVEEKIPVNETLTEVTTETDLSSVKDEKQSIEATKDSIFTPESMLLSIPASHYTLQLSAMASEASLKKFILQYQIEKDSFYVYRTVHDNKPRYVLIYGEYDDWASANKASKNLPGLLKNIDTWTKKYQLVHQDLQLNNE